MIWDRRQDPATAAADANSLAVMICFPFVFVFNSSYVIDYLFPFLFLMLNLLSSQSKNSFEATRWLEKLLCWRTQRNPNCYFETLFENSFLFFFVSSSSSSSFFWYNTRMCVFFYCACECETKIKTKSVMYRTDTSHDVNAATTNKLLNSHRFMHRRST